MRSPVCPERTTFSGTLTFIQPLLTEKEIFAVSAVPPRAVRRSVPELFASSRD